MLRQYGTFFALALMNAAVSVQLAAPAEARMPGAYEWGILDAFDVSSTVGVERPVAAKAVDLAVQEWEHWGRQTLRSNRRVKRQKGEPKIHFEKDSGYAERVGEFWAVVNNEKWTGKTNEPWSAAFVSWVMQEAGAGKAFRYSGAHSVYIRAAIANRKAGKLDAGFVGYRIEEMAPRLGDLVCYSREEKQTATYDSVKHYPSHCDVVVATGEDEIEVIGGNVQDSVSKKILAVDREGLVADQGYRWFAVIRTNL